MWDFVGTLNTFQKEQRMKPSLVTTALLSGINVSFARRANRRDD